ncbi:MAG: DNA polymerase III subunit delta [Rikenellaceae bacterium]
MKFGDIIGHEGLKSRLRRSIRDGRIPHSQLFSGLSGYGTLPLAIAYVQYLNCRDRSDDDSCGVCASCLQVSELSHPDLHLVMPVNKQGKKGDEGVISEEFIGLFRSNFKRHDGYVTPIEWYNAMNLGKTMKGLISASEADDIIRQLSFKSYSADYKSMVIWLPEMMNEHSANKLLKIFEEPWDKTLFILVSESPDKLLPTINSRMQEVTIPRIDSSTLEHYAESCGVTDASQRRSIARVSAGDLRELKRLIEGRGASDRRELFDLFAQLMRLSYNDKHLELLTWAEDVAQLTRTEQLDLLRYSILLLREAYIRHAGLPDLCYTWGEEGSFCAKFAPFIGNENIEFLVGECEHAIVQISQSANPTILFTHFALCVSKEIKRKV